MPRLLMYVRNRTCPDQELARRCLTEFELEPIEINISRDRDAAQTLMEWIGSLSVPTLVVVGEDSEPITPPRRIGSEQSARNIDRGSIISEPDRDGLRAFLIKHGLISDGQSTRH